MMCYACNRPMKKVQDVIEKDGITFEGYKCPKCGEEILDMNQLKALAEKYKNWRKAKEIEFSKWGNSIAVRIPSKMAKELSIKPGSQGIIRKGSQGIIITPL
jgi:hypothetical protein